MKKLNQVSNKLIELDKEMKCIINETLEDLQCVSINQNHNNIKVLNKVLRDGFISDFETLEYLIGYYSNILLSAYNYNSTEFVKWFDIETPSEFYKLRNHYLIKNCNMSVCFEHFYMFNKLTNGKVTIYNTTTSQLQQIKDLDSEKKVG